MAGAGRVVGVGGHDPAHHLVAGVGGADLAQGGGGKGGTVAVNTAVFAETGDFNGETADLRIPTGEGRSQQARTKGTGKAIDGA